jgi:hypothetical protein
VKYIEILYLITWQVKRAVGVKEKQQLGSCVGSLAARGSLKYLSLNGCYYEVDYRESRFRKGQKSGLAVSREMT